MDLLVGIITKTLFAPLTRYQLQLQVTAGQTSTTFKDILESKQKFQGIGLDLLSLLPKFVIRVFFGTYSRRLFSSIPEQYLLDGTISELPVICFTHLVNHPILCMHQQQATFNRNVDIIEVWGNLNRSPQYFFQGVFAGIFYESMLRILAHFINKIPFVPFKNLFFPSYLIASWILYPLRTIQSHQMDNAIFGKTQSITQSTYSIYESSGLLGFWSGSFVFLWHQFINGVLLAFFKRLTNS